MDGDGLCDEEEGCGDPEACNYDPTAVTESADYCLIVDTVAVHTAGNLAGDDLPLLCQVCKPSGLRQCSCRRRHQPHGGLHHHGILPGRARRCDTECDPAPLFGAFPDLFYDSWVTIGLSSAPDAAIGEANVSTVQSSDNPWTTNFEPGFGAPGGDIVINDEVGGAWYALNGDNNGIAASHPDQQVLIAQLTTDGHVEGNFFVQIFENGDGQDGELFFSFNIGESCLAPDDDCLYPSDVYGVDYVDCDGNCLNDADQDWICDEEEVPGCTDEMALNYDSEATDDDGTCEYPAASVFDIIASSEMHTVLEDFIVAADLAGTLTNDGPWTSSFTDAAVGALPAWAGRLFADLDLLAGVDLPRPAAPPATCCPTGSWTW